MIVIFKAKGLRDNQMDASNVRSDHWQPRCHRFHP